MASLPTFKHCKLAVISSYVPRRCGIATFCSDLTRAMMEELGHRGELYILAIDDIPEGYRYPDEVRFQIRGNVQTDYRLAADFIISNQANAIIVQHEYGIFGGPAGAHILRLLREVSVPVLTTLHTVLANPSAEQRKVMDELWRLSDRLVVMNQRAIEMLREIYGVPAERIAYVPHGIPDVPFVDPNYHKARFKAEGRRVILTFGLLSPNKGIEVMIEAMPEVVRRYPDVIYIILGATHPHLKKVHGEAYRTSLQRRVVDLGLVENVRFRNQFVDLEELLEYIGAADLYVTPYLNEAQITSGTLAYAVGSGKAVISTPYWHAQELLADGRGILVPFRDPVAMAEATNYLFDNDIERNQMRIKAYHHCRNMVWKQVARDYLLLMQAAQEERMERPRPLPRHRQRIGRIEELPELDLTHLRVLTDDTGIIQHAIHTTPDRQHGYCLDDCGRALVVCALHDQLFQSHDLNALANVYMAYLTHAFVPKTRRFHNFMSYSRQWLDNEGSEDSHGRALWGLGMMAAHATNANLRAVGVTLFQQAIGSVEGFSSPRAWAYALLGIHAYLEHYGGDAGVRRIRSLLADKLFVLFREHADQEWPWFESTATYSNATIPHALILAGTWIPDGAMREQGLRTLRWLCDIQRSEQGHFSFIGNSGWYPRGGEKARFDQQPIEAAQLCYACAEAYRTTVDEKWLAESRLAVEWFLGRNDLDVPIYDFASGGCRDGLSPEGPNFNQGAESTLAWLISLLTFLNQVSRQTLHVKPGGALEQADSTRADTVVAQADMSH